LTARLILEQGKSLAASLFNQVSEANQIA
jgi:hypothetical protein